MGKATINFFMAYYGMITRRTRHAIDVSSATTAAGGILVRLAAKALVKKPFAMGAQLDRT